MPPARSDARATASAVEKLPLIRSAMFSSPVRRMPEGTMAFCADRVSSTRRRLRPSAASLRGENSTWITGSCVPRSCTLPASSSDRMAERTVSSRSFISRGENPS